MTEWYKQKIQECEAKAKAAAEMADLEQYEHWIREADNYRRMAGS